MGRFWRLVPAAAVCALFVAPTVAGVYDHITAPTGDFSRPEAYERNPGGATTSHRVDSRSAFLQPAENLAAEDRLDFSLGNAVFRRLWVAAPASTRATDGLGPLYNARACDRCHIRNGRGHTPDPAMPEDSAISILMRLSVPPSSPQDEALLASGHAAVIPDPIYGGQLQDVAVAGHPAEGQIAIAYEERSFAFPDGETVSLRAPTYAIAGPAYGDPDPGLMLSVRIAPQMIGLGLLEAIPDADILAHADPDDGDGDGISGRPNYGWDSRLGTLALGRFGWKAGQPSLAQQNAAALSGDMGLSSPAYPAGAGDCTVAQASCVDAPDGNSPEFEGLEVPSSLTGPLELYTRHLAVPARRDIDDPTVLHGKAMFYGAGCAACHVPKFITATDAARPALSHQLIWPYSDLLLHDMGDGLADNRPEGQADGREWRTPPLWGIGLIDLVNGDRFLLHDGRARTLTEAILWHGGEAEAARAGFVAMSPADRAALLAFLESL
ncbi:MAG: di-heme oxidoredictase family protein [Alphaproteobacteria bacterium]